MAANHGIEVDVNSRSPEIRNPGMCTPVRDFRRQPFDSGEMQWTSQKVFEDDASTAPPSLWMSPSVLESPLPSPFPMTGTNKQHEGVQSGNLVLPDILPTLDFELLSEKLPDPTACMTSSPSSEVDGRSHMTPCITPRCKNERPTTPPPRPRPEVSPFMKALQSKSVDLVRQALLDEPWAAQRPLSETHEPPLCAAVRLGSIPEIIQLLLVHGADVNASDCNGRTPLRTLETRLKLHKFEIDHLGANDVELPEALCRSKALLEAQAGVLKDDPALDQDFEMDVSSNVWNRLPSGPLPFVNNIDLFQHFTFLSSAVFAGQTVHTQ